MGFSVISTSMHISVTTYGIYIIIVWISDIYYRGNYVLQEFGSKSSTVCLISCVVALNSSMAAVLAISIIPCSWRLYLKVSLHLHSPFVNPTVTVIKIHSIGQEGYNGLI